MKMFLSILLLVVVVQANAEFSDDSEDGDLVSTENYGYISKSAIWKVTSIPVCWENPSDKYKKQMQDVRQAINASWANYSKLTFTGWGTCPNSFVGIRIKIADEWPHVEVLGAKLSGMKNGMVLNFDFGIEEFSACNANQTMYQLCVDSIAVHEFGHGIGFAHEQDRNDKDRNCNEESVPLPDGIKVTKYDYDSVMNYCNPKYNNNGRLSALDVVSVQSIYGKKTNGN